MSLGKSAPEVADRTMTRGIAYGVLGGVTGMLAMDFVMVVEFSIAQMPPTTYLSLIGSVFGGGVALGTVVHLVVGALPGLCLGLAAVKVKALRIDTLQQGLRWGFILGVLSIPLAVSPLPSSPMCRS